MILLIVTDRLRVFTYADNAHLSVRVRRPAFLHIRKQKHFFCTSSFFFFFFLFFGPAQSFRVHSGGCLISFHSRFFTVTLCWRPICRRPGKSHYSYTWGKNRPFISIVVVNTNQRGHIDPCFFSPSAVCIKSLFFFRDCWVFLSLRGRRFKSSPVGPLRGRLKGAVRGFEEERALHRLAFDARTIKLSLFSRLIKQLSLKETTHVHT